VVGTSNWLMASGGEGGQRLYTFTLLARLKTSLRRQGLPLRACVPRSGVCTSASTHEGGGAKWNAAAPCMFR
jgi:hypothetical protein